MDIRTFWESAGGRQIRKELRKASQTLEISLTDILVKESTPYEYRRVFTEIAHDPPDAILVSGTNGLFPYRQLIVELGAKGRWPGMHPWRDYVEAGGLMAYGTDLVELWRRMADDVPPRHWASRSHHRCSSARTRSSNEAAYLSHLVDGSGARVIGIARGAVAGQDPSGQDPDTCRPR